MQSSDELKPSPASDNCDESKIPVRKQATVPNITSSGCVAMESWAQHKKGTSSFSSQKRKRQRTNSPRKRRKLPGMPQRPLTAYNCFFRDERLKILADRKVGKLVPKGSTHSLQTESEERNDKKEPGLFETMARIIAGRWKRISPERHDYYQHLANDDLLRYEREKEGYEMRKAGGQSFKEAPVSEQDETTNLQRSDSATSSVTDPSIAPSVHSTLSDYRISQPRGIPLSSLPSEETIRRGLLERLARGDLSSPTTDPLRPLFLTRSTSRKPPRILTHQNRREASSVGGSPGFGLASSVAVTGWDIGSLLNRDLTTQNLQAFQEHAERATTGLQSPGLEQFLANTVSNLQQRLSPQPSAQQLGPLPMGHTPNLPYQAILQLLAQQHQQSLVRATQMPLINSCVMLPQSLPPQLVRLQGMATPDFLRLLHQQSLAQHLVLPNGVSATVLLEMLQQQGHQLPSQQR